MKHYLAYQQLKTFIITNSLNWYYIENTKKYYIYTVTGSIIFETNVFKLGYSPVGLDDAQNTTDRTDFETNYKSIANTKLANEVSIKGFRNFKEDLYRKSFKYNIVANTTNEFSESFDTDIYLSGGKYEIDGTINDGDYIEFTITDEDNVLGYGAGFVVSKFVETEYLTESNKKGEITSEDAALVPSSLYLTAIYHCAGVETPKFVVRYSMRK